ncbi:MAG TPA: glycerophosphoryl diester phosphodiesterase membrane domain-containing protein [Gemmatimonadales bacterium]|nr:glycerophosphoryl diester phosphodiesterase membrane domain-containing protein [Gemmatimonadales bacterium]
MTAVALRPLSLGEILDTTFQVYRRYFPALVPIVLFCYGPPVLIDVFVQTSNGHAELRLIGALLNLVLGAIATAATVFIISEGYLGRAITGQEAFHRATPYLGRLILASFAFGLIVALGTILLVVPGIIAACGLALTWPAIVLEGLSWDAGLRRSWELTRGHRGTIFLLMVVLMLLLILPMIAVGALVGFMAGLVARGGMLAGAAALATATVVGLVQLAIYPLFNCALTIVYYDLRVRKEGFDLEVLASTLQPA